MTNTANIRTSIRDWVYASEMDDWLTNAGEGRQYAKKDPIGMNRWLGKVKRCFLVDFDSGLIHTNLVVMPIDKELKIRLSFYFFPHHFIFFTHNLTLNSSLPSLTSSISSSIILLFSSFLYSKLILRISHFQCACSFYEPRWSSNHLMQTKPPRLDGSKSRQKRMLLLDLADVSR